MNTVHHEYKPTFNYFSHFHTDFLGSIQIEGSLVADYSSAGYMLLDNSDIINVHEPTIIEMHNYMHYNPAPVFIPEPSVTIPIFVLSLVFFLKRKIR